jgi:hypothetical protein
VSVSEEKEHIYEHVSYDSPVNIFLGLLQSETETISPDPNIYEVPPGAIFNKTLINVEESDSRKLKPPDGFRDYENICCDPQTDFDEEVFTLPVEVIYSTVVKPKRKKCRPHLSVMLQEDDKAPSISAQGINNEMNAGTDMSNNVTDENRNEDILTRNTICSASNEHGSSHIQMSCSDAFFKGDVINHKEDCNDVCIEDRCSSRVSGDNVASCESNMSSTPTDTSITSHEDHSVSTEVNNCVDNSENNPVEAKDNLLNSSVEDENGVTEFLEEIYNKIDNSVAPCASNRVETKLDNCTASCGHNLINNHTVSFGKTEIHAKDPNCIKSCESGSIDTRVDNFVPSYKDSTKDNEIQGNTNDISVVSSEDIAINANGDKCLSIYEDFKTFSEKDSSRISCGDNSENGGCTEAKNSLSNVITNSNFEELPRSTFNAEITLSSESEMEIPDILGKDNKNVEDSGCAETSVIEISEDGTWETKTLPPAEVEQANQEDESRAEQPEFLCAVDRSAETVKMAYGSQYYVNCPVASVKPMRHENASGEDDDTARNIGAQIMKKYEEEKQKIRDSLPDVSLLDVDSSLEDIQRERRRIIENQAVRAKRIDSWIKSGNHPGELPDDLLELGNVSFLEGSSLDASLSPITDFVLSVNNADDAIPKFGHSSVDTETCSTIKQPAEGK